MEQDLDERELVFPPGLLQGEESRELVLWLARDVVVPANHSTDPVTWEAVVGHTAAKQSLEECVLYPLRYPQLFSSLRKSSLNPTEEKRLMREITSRRKRPSCFAPLSGEAEKEKK